MAPKGGDLITFLTLEVQVTVFSNARLERTAQKPDMQVLPSKPQDWWHPSLKASLQPSNAMPASEVLSDLYLSVTLHCHQSHWSCSSRWPEQASHLFGHARQDANQDRPAQEDQEDQDLEVKRWKRGFHPFLAVQVSPCLEWSSLLEPLLLLPRVDNRQLLIHLTLC